MSLALLIEIEACRKCHWSIFDVLGRWVAGREFKSKFCSVLRTCRLKYLVSNIGYWTHQLQYLVSNINSFCCSAPTAAPSGGRKLIEKWAPIAKSASSWLDDALNFW